MATTNPITGDKMQTKPSDKYADNYDAIFRKDHHNELLKDDEMGFSYTNQTLAKSKA